MNKWELLSCVWLFVTPWTVAHQAPLSMGFSRPEYWSGLPFPPPGDLPDPGMEPRSPTLQADSLPAMPQATMSCQQNYEYAHHIYHQRRVWAEPAGPADPVVSFVSIRKHWRLLPRAGHQTCGSQTLFFCCFVFCFFIRWDYFSFFSSFSFLYFGRATWLMGSWSPSTDPRPSAVRVWSPNHWATREVACD